METVHPLYQHRVHWSSRHRAGLIPPQGKGSHWAGVEPRSELNLGLEEEAMPWAGVDSGLEEAGADLSAGVDSGLEEEAGADLLAGVDSGLEKAAAGPLAGVDSGLEEVIRPWSLMTL